MVWPLTIYWTDGGRPRQDLAARTEEEAEEMAERIRRTWPGVLSVHVEEPTGDAEEYELIQGGGA